MARLGAGAVMLLALLAGCTTGSSELVQNVPESFEQQIAHALESARSDGSSDAQIALLEQAAAEGEVTYEIAREAARNDIDCMIAAGLDATYLEQKSNGVAIPGYSVQVGMDDDDSLLDKTEACDRLEFSWVSSVFQTQPSIQAVRDAHEAKYVPQMLQCLEDAGVPQESDASWDELVNVAALAKNDGEPAGECMDVIADAAIGD